MTSLALAATTQLPSAVVAEAGEDIGAVTEQTGPTEIQRESKSIPSKVSAGVQMNDAVVTAAGRVQITFRDETKVQITEQSKLVIDDFVYDPNQDGAGKLAIKVALGTARYASGQIAKENPQHVKIETPTATIAVRGTDFSMTVDELGRSLVILLPSCPSNFRNVERDCKTGKIDVTTDMGTVHMDRPFQATVTTSRETNPAKPVILNLSMDQIGNMLIVTPPREARRAAVREAKTALDVNFLDQDFLKFDELNADLFASEGSRLDVNYLDAEFLANMLDLLNSQLLESMLGGENQMLPNYKANRAAGLMYVKEDSYLILYRSGTNSFAQVGLDKDSPTNLYLNQDSVQIKQVVNNTTGSTIRINQSQ